LALAPGETNESFIREVDENLRRDQAEDFFKRYGKWLIAGALLILAITAGLIWWRGQQAERSAANSEKLTAVMGEIGAGKFDAAAPRLGEIAKSGSDADRAAALLTQAAVALQRGDRKAASTIYAQVAADSGLPQPWRDLGTVRGTSVDFDTLAPEVVISRLQPLATAGNPWFGTAGELTAMAMLKQNRRAEAGRMFAAIAADTTAPASLRGRAEQIAGTLGASVPANASSARTAPAPL
jgi:hypothetical protein